MPTAFISGWDPNRLTAQNSQNTTNMILIAMDGTGYSSLTALLAAGKTPFPFGNASTPGLDKGMFTQYLTVENITEAKAFYVVTNWNSLTPPTSANGILIPDGIVLFEFKGPVGNLWIQKSVGTDVLNFTVGY